MAFRKAVAKWYADRYGVTLDPAKEILALIGSKEGVHHFCLGVVDAGETVLMTDPGYPAYRASIIIAGGVPVSVPIRAKNNFLIDFSEIPSETAKAAKAIFLNYPNNPTGAVANREVLRGACRMGQAVRRRGRARQPLLAKSCSTAQSGCHFSRSRAPRKSAWSSTASRSPTT